MLIANLRKLSNKLESTIDSIRDNEEAHFEDGWSEGQDLTYSDETQELIKINKQVKKLLKNLDVVLGLSSRESEVLTQMLDLAISEQNSDYFTDSEGNYNNALHKETIDLTHKIIAAKGVL